MNQKVTMAAVACGARPGNTEANLACIAEWAAKAAAERAELVMFPELSVTGFLPNHPQGDHAEWLRAALTGAWRMAEPLDGPAVSRLIEIARGTGVMIAAGLLENAGNLLYNTHVLVDHTGLLGWWRKMHVPVFEMQIYNGGGGPAVIETRLGRIGVNICFDSFLPESTRLLAVDRAEIVLFPFAADQPTGWAPWASPVLRARACENGVFALASNVLGAVEFNGLTQVFPGGAIAVGPDGAVIGEADPMLVVEFCRESLLAARASFEYTFRHRRPELYGPLTRT